MAWRAATPHHLKNLWRIGEKSAVHESAIKTIYAVQAIPVKPANPCNDPRKLVLTTPGNPWSTVEYLVDVNAGTFEARIDDDGKAWIGKNIKRISST